MLIKFSGNTKQKYLSILALVFTLPLSMMYSSLVYAIDPPANIQINDGQLSWDPVEGVNEYHLYYFDQPVPSITNVGNYVRLTGGTRWSLRASNDPFGYYTVVAVLVDRLSVPIDFSKITEGIVVPYLDPNDTPSISSSISIDVVSEQCDNMVVGSVCAAACAAPAIATGGACRADAGVTIHQRALGGEYQCLTQQDTSFIQADVYCLSSE